MCTLLVILCLFFSCNASLVEDWTIAIKTRNRTFLSHSFTLVSNSIEESVEKNNILKYYLSDLNTGIAVYLIDNSTAADVKSIIDETRNKLDQLSLRETLEKSVFWFEERLPFEVTPVSVAAASHFNSAFRSFKDSLNSVTSLRDHLIDSGKRITDDKIQNEAIVTSLMQSADDYIMKDEADNLPDVLMILTDFISCI